MKLPPGSEIPWDKLTLYLLVRKSRADKSAFLARAGYTLLNAHQLREDLRTQILPLDAQPARSNNFGAIFQIDGDLVGPSGLSLPIRTIWIKDPLSCSVRFVTLIPNLKP